MLKIETIKLLALIGIRKYIRRILLRLLTLPCSTLLLIRSDR
jgi:hypothetical protein